MLPRIPNKYTQRRVLAPLAVASSIVVVAAALYQWSKKETGPHDKPKTAPKRAGSPNPTLSLSLPADPSWTSKPVPEEVVDLLQSAQADYNLHVLVNAPDGQPLKLPCDKVLAYANAQGRAMMQRALKCQLHVELVFVDKQGWIAWDAKDELSSYLDRLNQLAQVVDKMLVVLMPANPAPNAIALQDLDRSWKKHAIAQNPHTYWLDMRQSAWQGLQEELGRERLGWS